MLAGLMTSSSAQRPAAPLPTVPPVHGPLKPQVAYPAPGSLIDAGDSTFLFGTVGDGDARLTVNGQPVAVAPNGAWIAWIAIPHDSSFLVTLVARRAADSATASVRLARAGWVRETGAWVDRASATPTGEVWMPPGEPLALSVRAVPGATVQLLLPSGALVRFAADSIEGSDQRGRAQLRSRRSQAGAPGSRRPLRRHAEQGPQSEGWTRTVVAPAIARVVAPRCW